MEIRVKGILKGWVTRDRVGLYVAKSPAGAIQYTPTRSEAVKYLKGLV